MRRTCMHSYTAAVVLALLIASSFAAAQTNPGEDPWPPPGLGNAWVNSNVAVDHTVPPPWTEMQVDGSSVQMWGRQTDFEGQALPAQIITQQTPLLVDRVQVLLQSSGTGDFVPMPEGKGAIKEQHPDKVVYNGQTILKGVTVDTQVNMEFDGFTWVTLTVRPTGNVKLRRMSLEIPIRADAAKYYNKRMEGYSPVLIKDMWGKVESRALKLNNYFNLVNEDIGLGFFAEGREGWLQDRIDRQVEWIVVDGQVKVRFNFIDLQVPQSLKAARTISIGWSALPTKPMPPDWRRYFVYSIGSDPSKAGIWAKTGMTPIFIKLTRNYEITPENISKWQAEIDGPDGLAHCPWSGLPKPYSYKGFNKFADRLRQECPGSKVTIYTVGTEHTALDPVVYENQDKWSATSAKFSQSDIDKARQTKGECPSRLFMCGWSNFPDYRVWSFDYLFEKLNIDGYYYDNQIFRPCKNPAHKDHVRVDHKGEAIEVTPILAARETYKRIYKALKKRNPDSIIVGHELLVPYPFIDIAIGLEAMLPLAGDRAFYTSFMTPDDCRGPFFRGHQRGVPFLWLPEHRGEMQSGAQSIRAGRAMLSLLWLSDTQYWAAWMNLRVFKEDLNVRGSFKIWQAQWLPFWSQNLVTPEQNDIKVAVYSKPRASLLLISNPGKNAYSKAVISINVGDGMFSSDVDLQNLEIRDAETGHPIAGRRWLSEDKTFYNIELAIPDQDFRIVVIGDPEAVKDSVIQPLNAAELKAVEDRRNQWISETGATASATDANSTIVARRVAGKITIDGKLDEDDWSKARAYSGFVIFNNKTSPADPQTEIRVAHDAQNVYFAAKVWASKEGLSTSWAPQKTELDATRPDCIEWYIAREGAKSYHWFGMNLFGYKGDAHFGGGHDEPFDWNGVWTGCVKQYDGYWIVEAAIPWSQLSIKPGDEKLKMNAARSLVLRRENEKKVFSVLNHETAGFHSPDAVLTLE